MEVAPAIRRHLLNQDEVRAFVQEKVYRGRLLEGVEETGGVAIVVTEQASWSGRDDVKTPEFPRVWTEIYADSTRDAEGSPVTPDAEDKARAVFRVLDRLMHGRRGVRWGAYGSNPGLMVVSCVGAGTLLEDAASQHPAYKDLPEHVVRLRAVWNLQVAHG